MRFRTFLLVALVPLAMACGPADGDRTLVVFNAGSLARPMRAALDSFVRRERLLSTAQESAGSLETARKLTELGKIPDLVALADAEVFPRYLVPGKLDGYVEFARNRMVIAFTGRSKHASEITPDNWWRIALRPGVEVGRSDPQLDPNGYRTLIVWKLAERHYGVPGLAARLEAASPPRNMRPKEADLIGLLEAGELDYVWSYESLVHNLHLSYVTLPSAIDLASADSAAAYATARVTVRGARAGDSVTFQGAPIIYAFGIPRAAPHRALAEKFAAYLLSAEGREVLRAEGLDALDSARARGTVGAWASAPAAGAAAPAPESTTRRP